MMRRLLYALAAMLAAAPAAAQEGGIVVGDVASPRQLHVLGSTDVEFSRPLFEGFVASRPDVSVRYEELSTKELYDRAKAACDEGRADGDLWISSAIDLQVSLVNDLCAQPHRSRLTDAMPDWAKWRNEVFGLTFEPAVLVYNRALLPPDQAPRSRFDLVDLLRSLSADFRGRIATYDIEESGVGYLFAFQDAQRATTFGRLIEAFGRAEAEVKCCTTDIVDGVALGRYLIGYNVLGSYARERAKTDERIGIVELEDYTLVLSRAAVISRQARHPGLAGALIDYALSEEGRRILAGVSMLRQSIAEDASHPSNGEKLEPIALSPVVLVGQDAHKRASFIELWKKSLD